MIVISGCLERGAVICFVGPWGSVPPPDIFLFSKLLALASSVSLAAHHTAARIFSTAFLLFLRLARQYLVKR